MDKRIIKFSVIVCVMLFSFSTYFGYLTAKENPAVAENMVKELSLSLDFVKNLTQVNLLLFIFINNSVKALLMIVSGFFFCIIPVIFIFFNGYVLGIVYATSVKTIGAVGSFFGVAPHGIFELAGILYAAGLGVWLGIKFFEKLKYKTTFKPFLKYAIRHFFMFILPFLFVAAFIEAFLTLKISEYFSY
jgi:stage II sporulation protein M